MMTSDGAEINCTNVTRRYYRGSPSRVRRLLGRAPDRPAVDALQGVTCSIDAGEFVSITGPSGSGKSTLLHLIAGLDTPTDGTVTVGEEVISGYSARERTRFRLNTVGVVFQHFHLVDALSARANVALPLVERGTAKSERRDRAIDLLTRVGLEERLTHKPRELSGGEQQRVAIARALATDPPLLIADEPTGELDSATAHQVLSVLESVAGDRTIILATHDERALEYTNRQLRMQDGQLRDSDSTSDTAGDRPDGS